jgi:hypothetical protein
MSTNLDFRPQRINIQAYAGDDLTFDIPATDGAGNPVDLTGATATAQIRATHTSADPAIDFTVVVGTDKITLSLDAATTATLPASAVWDCEVSLVGPPLQTKTVAAGTITTSPDVTRGP